MLQNISIVACSEAFKRIYRDKNCNNISVSKIHSLTQKKHRTITAKVSTVAQSWMGIPLLINAIRYLDLIVSK